MAKKPDNGTLKDSDTRPVAIYTRVSTRVQFRDGLSVEAQKSILSRAVDLFAPGRKAVEFVDQSSGRSAKRPEYSAMIRDMKGGRFSMVFAFSTDRLSRNTGDFGRFLQVVESKSIALYIHNLGVTNLSPVGKLLLTMLSAVGEFESDMISQRTKASIEHLAGLRKKGPGHRPFGWQVDEKNNLIEDPNEQRLIMLANQFRAEGWSWRKIAQYANNLDIPPAGSEKWDEFKIRQSVNSANGRHRAIADASQNQLKIETDSSRRDATGLQSQSASISDAG